MKSGNTSKAVQNSPAMKVSHHQGFWVGVAMATPFYAEFFPWAWAMVLSLPMFYLAINRRITVYAPHNAILPMVILLVLHCAALALSETPFRFQVIKDSLIASYLLAVYFLADEQTADGFFLVMVPLGVISATIGLIKAALLDRGYLIGFILDNCSSYPAGSALCVNYNNLGLLWLVASLGCLWKRWWLFLPILVAAGALSSSRRFLLLVALLPFIWILIQGKSAVIKAILASLATAFLIIWISDPGSFERFRFGKEPYTVIWDFKSSLNATTTLDHVVLVNRSVPIAMLGTLADGTLGAASRLDLWKYGFENLDWLPQGWTYHEKFSCEFFNCLEFQYPHLAILSEWIIGGVIFGIIAIMFYLWPAFMIWKQKSVLHIALLMIAMPYSLISGDTVFSLPIYVACMLIALSCIPKKPLPPKLLRRFRKVFY